MFSDVGWGEIFLLFVVGLVVIGPERLPRVVRDVKAALTAARTAIDNAKQGLGDELGADFEEISKPLSELAALQRLGPRAALTKTLLDGAGSFLDALDPKKIMEDEQPKPASSAAASTQPKQSQPESKQSVEKEQQTPGKGPDDTARGDFSWADIT